MVVEVVVAAMVVQALVVAGQCWWVCVWVCPLRLVCLGCLMQVLVGAAGGAGLVGMVSGRCAH